ncbi:MAG: hypothetical protein ACLTR5_05535 [Oscillospiraceae bacterium]
MICDDDRAKYCACPAYERGLLAYDGQRRRARLLAVERYDLVAARI